LIDTLAKGAFNLSREAVRIPGQVVSKIGDYGLDVFTQTLDLVAPKQTTKEFVDSLIQQEPIAEAECAVRALKAAARARTTAEKIASSSVVTGDEASEVVVKKVREAKTLSSIGYAMIKKAAVRAHDNDEIPDRITQDVVFTALEFGADPEKKGFLEEGEMQPVAEVFDKFNNVTPLQNRL
jgi:hypothetical protein